MQLAHVAQTTCRRLNPSTREAQVGPVRARQQHEAGVVGNQMQTPELLLGDPSDPAVPRLQLEGARNCQPTSATHVPSRKFRHMTQAAAHQALERQVVMILDQMVPTPTFFQPPGRTHTDRSQRPGVQGWGRGRVSRHATHYRG